MARFFTIAFAVASSAAVIGYGWSAGGDVPGRGLYLFHVSGAILVLLSSSVAPSLLLCQVFDRNHVRITFVLMTLLTAGIAAWLGTTGVMQPSGNHPNFNSSYYLLLPIAFLFNLALLGGGWLLRTLGVRVGKPLVK